MDDRTFNKTIGYCLAIILGYYIVGIFIPMLTWGVVGLVVFRIYQEHQKRKR
jgi:hypothetical protein